jgi:hypothetical protein
VYRITASMYSHGVQEYYTVEAILYFYTQLVIQHLSYENYLRLTVRHDIQAVRQADQQAGLYKNTVPI